TWAVHSSSYGESLNVAGNPCGFVIKMGGKNIYHAGDTDVFYDMKLIGERNNLDVALLPIGGFYTMDSHDAIYAVEYLQPKIVIPMHYNTFPIIKADAMEFKKNVETKTKAKCIILKPGEFLEL
ncbi:metal-dependent hydrolase, partial [Candidatus Marsarchaeota G1 archaeon OSP_B]